MKKFIKITLAIFCVSIFLTSFSSLIYYLSITNNVDLHSNLLKNTTKNIEIYDKDGKKIDNIYNQYITYDDLPKNLVDAVVAIEDKRFYKHNGIDIIRIFGAIKNNVKARAFVEGGSTISQQLIKNTHLTSEKSINRKLKEIKLAKELEKNYSKNEIIEMYLNVVYFGLGQYGVNNASYYYFNKSPKNLSLSECALLAGILKNPNKYSPKNSLENAKNRRNIVLTSMLKQKFIENNEFENAINENISLNLSVSTNIPYMTSVFYEASQILKINKNELINGNYKIYTNFDQNIQSALFNILNNHENFLENEHNISPERLGLILDNTNSTVSAYYSTQNHNIFTLTRPYGSTIKPILIYAPALQNNIICACTPVIDEKCDFNGYSPKNYNDKYLGKTTVRNAILTSSNVVAVKTFNTLNTQKIVDFAKNIDILIKNDDINATLALGAFSNNNLLKLVGAYSMLGNLGEFQSPTFITKIADKDDNVLYEKANIFKRVLDSADAYILTDILKENAEYGTSKGLMGLNIDIASKTGTVGDEFGNSDAYNISYNKDFTYLIWHGNSTGIADNNLSLDETGGSYVTKCMRELLKHVCVNKNSYLLPNNVIILPIVKSSLNDGKIIIADEDTAIDDYYFELFKEDNLPI